MSKLLSVLKRTEGRPAIVVNGGDYKGVVSISNLLRNVDVSKTKVSSILKSAPALSANHSLDDAIRLMRDADVRALPVVERDKVTGVLPARAVLGALVKHPLFSNVNAGQLVSANPISISPDDELSKAVQLMRARNVRKLGVMGKQGTLDGVLKLKEIAGDVLLNVDRSSRGDSYKKGKGAQSVSASKPLSVSVKSFMDSAPVSVLRNEKASNVLKSLALQTNPVVVVQGVGLITTQDVLNYYLSHSESEALPISITHLPDIDEIDRAFVEESLARTFNKLMRLVKSPHSLKAVFKQSKKDGLRAQTEVKLTLSGAGPTFNARSTNWKVRLATLEACNSLEAEVSKRFKRGKPS